MPADKMLRLFIIQAISSFVAGDRESGLHYLNEVKTSFAQYQSSLNPTLKSLAKEIIQSLDMFAPGASSTAFTDVNAGTPQQEMAAAFSQTQESSPKQPVFEEPTQETQQVQPIHHPTDPAPSGSPDGSVTSDLEKLLARRKARRKNK
ncbi:MAG: hypothetical protein INQ03_04335 [Candidatus Heimdallarchaeota archaeon]|nr:hypothetical protein [Candidatus Heimdallarchaeota archaeon]